MYTITSMLNPKIMVQRSDRMTTIREMCHAVANDMGIPLIRIDFMVPHDDSLPVRINELTPTPTANNFLGLGSGAYMDGIVRMIDDHLQNTFHRHSL